ncbi:MAG: hypothetical protein Q9219_002061 [cf. Caloplaca sp. 3 TL-2023]
MFISVYYLYFLLSVWTHAVLASPLPGLVSPDELGIISNLSFGPVPRQMSFRVDSTYPLTFSPDTAFINVVDALKILAQRDFRGYTAPRTFRTYRYPQLTITLTSPNMAPMKTEYVIWGLYMTYSWIARPGMARLSHFIVLWNLQPVGGINYGGALLADGKQESNDTVAAGGLTKLEPIDRQKSNLVEYTDLSNRRFSLEFAYFGPDRAFQQQDMQAAILNALTQAAQFPATTAIRSSWAPRIQDNRCLFVAHSLGGNPSAVLEFRWVIEAAAAAATYIMDRRVFRGLSGLIKFEDDVIGKVIFYAPPRGGVAGDSGVETS